MLQAGVASALLHEVHWLPWLLWQHYCPHLTHCTATATPLTPFPHTSKALLRNFFFSPLHSTEPGWFGFHLSLLLLAFHNSQDWVCIEELLFGITCASFFLTDSSLRAHMRCTMCCRVVASPLISPTSRSQWNHHDLPSASVAHSAFLDTVFVFPFLSTPHIDKLTLAS